ncbi:hypothetical protein FBEOM_2904 [Fusarium beomiforme]|uniref:Uncharacterized protein n=1 Tax=Fusarium beomiforme TaxID=44412 RepID=A0A9P5E1E3_9HYPO|nr:hypothetical protein FBEOM_2904 [Fusarium beomiforme]
MKTKRPPEKHTPKGKEHQKSNIIDLSESPAKNSLQKGSHNETNTAKKANGNNGQAQAQNARSNASAGSATTQDNPRRSFSTEQKCSILEICLSIKDRYLAMPLAQHQDQEPFWNTVWRDKLPSNLASKFSTWKSVKECVESWCYSRRTLLREGRLPVVSQGQPELETLVDDWNTVFVARFCQLHRGSSTEYDNAVKSVQDGFTASQRDRAQIVETEAVLSMAIELRPMLMKAIAQHLSGRQSHQDRDGESHTELTSPTGPAVVLRSPRQNGALGASPKDRLAFTIPSRGGSTSASSTAPQSNPATSLMPLGRNILQSIPGLGKIEPTRKRKGLEPPPRSTPPIVLNPCGPATSSSFNARTQSNSEQTSASNDPAKRQRLDDGSSSNAVARTEFPLRGRVEPNRPQGKLSPSRNASESRAPGKSPSLPAHRQDRSTSSFSSSHNLQYPDSWINDWERPRHPQPRGFREDTVEFEAMSVHRQNVVLRNQNRTILEKLEELKPRSERDPRGDRDSYRRY